MQETQVRSLGQEDPLEKQIATHSVFLLDSHMDRVAWQATVSVQFSCSVMSDSLRLHGQQHASHPSPSPTPGAHSNSRPLCRCCHPNISSSVIPFSSHFQSFPASGSFPKSWFFVSGGQRIGVSASASHQSFQ